MERGRSSRRPPSGIAAADGARYRLRVIVQRAPLLVVTALLAAACSKPEPPRITPKEARVTAVGPAGLDVVVSVEAVNPNRVTLTARSVTGKAKLDGRWDLGAVTMEKPVVLPPGTPTTIDVPMTMPWKDVGSLGVLAASPRPVPFVFDGTVSIGGERLNLELPFSVSGTVTREQLASAALRSLPGLPGLPGLTVKP